MGDKLTLTERIYHELYHDITSQKLCCGQKLTLTELKKRFNVSQTPIREALTRLTESGLVNYALIPVSPSSNLLNRIYGSCFSASASSTLSPSYSVKTRFRTFLCCTIFRRLSTPATSFCRKVISRVGAAIPICFI